LSRLALAVLAVLPYLPALAQPFFADDYIHVARSAAAASHPAALTQAWVLTADDSSAWWAPPELAVRYFRPLASLSFVADRALGGRAPFAFHLTNLLLHAATTLLAYAVARRVLPSGPAWLGAALFALHPCHAEAVLWVSARADLLCALFYLGAFLCHLRSRLESERRYGWWAAAGICLALSLMAKEMAVTFPLVVLLEVLAYSRGEPRRRRAWPPTLAAAIVAAYLAWRWSAVGPLGLPPRPFAVVPGEPGFATHVFVAVLQYLGDLVLFVPADPVVTLPFWQGHPAALALMATVAAAILLSSLRAVRDGRLRVLAAGMSAIALLPMLPLTVGEHFLYLPSFGYCLLIGAKLPEEGAARPGRGRTRLAMLGLLVGAVALARTLAFGALTRASRQAIDDTLAAWDAAPAATTLLVLDLPGPAALGFAHALRLERPGRPVQVEILTLSPQVLPAAPPTTSEADWQGADRLVVRRAGPLPASYIERAFAGERGPFAAGEHVDRGRLSVTVRVVRDGWPQSLEVSLAAPAEPVLLLRAEGFRLRAQLPPGR
jgi:protein O-mannosyl-transferase